MVTTQYPSDESMRVSYETMYSRLFIQARGVLKKELVAPVKSARSSMSSCLTTSKWMGSRKVLSL